MFKLELVKGIWYGGGFETESFNRLKTMNPSLENLSFYNRGQIVAISKNFIGIGRYCRNDVVINDANVRKFQFHLSVDSVGINYEEVDTKMPTCIVRAEKKLERFDRGLVYSGDLFVFGNTELRLLEAQIS